MSAKKSKVALVALLAAGLLPLCATGCGDDATGSGGDAGESMAGRLGSNAGKGNGGTSAEGGASTSQSGEGGEGEGGDDGSPVGGSAGKGGAGGSAGKGGGGTGGGGTGGGGTGGGGTGGGGTGGGGTGSGPFCGDGNVDEGEDCDHEGGNNYLEDDCGDVWGSASGENGSASACVSITPLACTICEGASECAELMDNGILTGNAIEGPATGTPRHALYNETLDCVRDTNCAAGNVLDCYCGTVSASQCDAGNGDGVCKTVIERGLETTNPTEISNRLTNVTLGGGLALARVACDKINCEESCF
jgi:hypothetical protein